MPYTEIPSNFGSGGKGLGPAGGTAHGEPTYVDLLAELQAAAPLYAEKQITHADLTAAATSEAVDFDSALPAGAVILGREITVTTPFSGGGASAATVDVGGTDTDAIVDGEDVFTGATTPKAGTSGINPNGFLGGQTLKATVTSDVNVGTLTAGDITVKVAYFVPQSE